jgi:Tfp pilus assembly protein PilO
MKDKLTPKVVAALAAVAVAAVALIGWFGLVSPQRSKTSDLDRQIAETQTQLAVAKADAGSGSGKTGASALVLARAMPQRVGMPGVLRQLLRAANRSDVRLDSVTPAAATAGTGYETVPMDIAVTGRYFAIQSFLHRLRTQTRVVGDRVHASGRLFNVETVNLAAGEAELPQLTATIHLNAFTYSGSAAAATSAASPESATDLSNSSSATAAGRTP